MSMLERIVAAVTPPETDAARRAARARSMNAATPGDWLAAALAQHLQIERAFDSVREALDGDSRDEARQHLALVLTGHAIAEESVLYPALAIAGEKGHAGLGYSEQAAVKTEMAELEALAPMSQDFLDKLEHISAAMAHHMYEEEGTWFLEIKSKVAAADQDKLSRRFAEEFERYTRAEDEYSAPALYGRPRAPLHPTHQR